MTTQVANWTAESCSTTGIGSLILTGAAPGHVRFSDSMFGGAVWYSIEDGLNREAGIGGFNGNNSITRSDVRATLVDGVYNDVNPAPIDLSGNAVVRCTFNGDAYKDLSNSRWTHLSTFASTSDILGEHIFFTNPPIKRLKLDFTTLRTETALDDIVVEIAVGNNYNLSEWFGPIAVLKDAVVPSVTNPAADGMTIVTGRTVVIESYDGSVELQDLPAYDNYWIATGVLGSASADKSIVTSGKLIHPAGDIDRIRVRSVNGDSFYASSRASLWGQY